MLFLIAYDRRNKTILAIIGTYVKDKWALLNYFNENTKQVYRNT